MTDTCTRKVHTGTTIGCDRCGWTRRERLSEPVTASLFEVAE